MNSIGARPTKREGKLERNRLHISRMAYYVLPRSIRDGFGGMGTREKSGEERVNKSMKNNEIPSLELKCIIFVIPKDCYFNLDNCKCSRVLKQTDLVVLLFQFQPAPRERTDGVRFISCVEGVPV